MTLTVGYKELVEHVAYLGNEIIDIKKEFENVYKMMINKKEAKLESVKKQKEPKKRGKQEKKDLEFKGKLYSRKEMAIKLNMKYQTLIWNLNHGKTINDIIIKSIMKTM